MSAAGKDPAQAGFTLLEMLVTLAVAALIAGIGYPSVARVIDRQEFVRALADTKFALRQAKAQAIQGDLRTPVRLNQRRQLMASDVAISPPMPASVTLILKEPKPVFFADGTAQAAEIVLRSRRYTAKLSVDRASRLVETSL
jgi:general secretion pathway protein H